MKLLKHMEASSPALTASEIVYYNASKNCERAVMGGLITNYILEKRILGSGGEPIIVSPIAYEFELYSRPAESGVAPGVDIFLTCF
jgi:hypothetical protein